ncbi:MAG: response regulator transcription factor [Ruminococcus sp.]|nr:response regulator transcription factor [Ruminococcus sp.]
MLRAVICDDDIAASELLKKMIKKNTDSKASVICTETCEKASELIDNRTDAVFMDICLSEANGINFAVELKERYPQLRIVFITAYTEYCEKIFKAQPVGFLVKPFKDESVRDVIEWIGKSMNDAADMITLRASKNAVVNIDLSEVYYIENSDRRLLFYGADEVLKGEARISLREAESRLPDYYIRCHHSFFVNMNNIKGIKRFAFTLTDGKELPISQGKFIQTRDRYFQYLGGLL